jgi:hypothetical protein
LNKGYKVVILQRIHSKIWHSTQKINKHFGVQIISCILMVLLITLYHGLLLVAKNAVTSTKWTQIPFTITPLNSIIMLSHSCFRCSKIFDRLGALFLKFSNLPQIRSTKLVEHYAMQIEMQKVEFFPRNFIIFDLKFCLDTIRFIIDYDIVFMQFYFG